MSTKKISELDSANLVSSSDNFVVLQSGTTKKASAQNLSSKIKNDIQSSQLNLYANVESTSVNTGSLTVVGGIGVDGTVRTRNLHCETNFYGGILKCVALTTRSLNAEIPFFEVNFSGFDSGFPSSGVRIGGVGYEGAEYIESTDVVSGALVVNGGAGISGSLNTNQLKIWSEASSSNASEGALVVEGGIGVGGNVNIEQSLQVKNGIKINPTNPIQSTSTTTGALTINGGIGISGGLNAGGAVRVGISTGTLSTSTSSGSLVVVGGVGISQNVNIGNTLKVNAGIDSTSAQSGTVIVQGGLGISGSIYGEKLNIDDIQINANTISSTNDINLNVNGVVKINSNEVATKDYVDATTQGLDVKKSVRVATTSKITFPVNNSFSGTATTVIDGVTISNGNRVLVKNQNEGIDNSELNGIWIVGPIWTRADDANTSEKVTSGMFVFVEEGTTNADTGWVLTNNGAISLGTTKLVFAQFTGTGQISAGTNLNKSGSSINLNNSISLSSISLSAGTASSSTGTGTLVVTGGVGLSGRITSGEVYSSGNSVVSGNLYIGPSSGNLTPGSSSGAGVLIQPGVVSSTSTMSGTIVCRGGVGIRGVVNIGGYTSGNEQGTISTSTSTGSLVVTGGAGISGNLNAKGLGVIENTNLGGSLSVGGTSVFTNTAPAIVPDDAAVVISGGLGVNSISAMSMSLGIDGNGTPGIESTSTDTGTLVINGGVGINGSINLSGGITAINSPGAGANSHKYSISLLSGVGDLNDPLSMYDAAADGFRIYSENNNELFRVCCPTGSGDKGLVVSNGFLVRSGNRIDWVPRIYSKVVGTGLDTNFTIDHNFGTRDVIVNIYRNGSPWDAATGATVTRPNLNNIQVNFSNIIGLDSFVVVVMGGGSFG